MDFVKGLTQRSHFSTSNSVNLKGKLLDLSVPAVMGVINLTTDSFYSGSRFSPDGNFISIVAQMVEEGVDILDLGAYSTRPGAGDVPVELEQERILKALQLVSEFYPDLPVSIDTFRAQVASKALENGAAMINDVSAGNLDPEMIAVIRDFNVPYVAMHSRGTPATMANLTSYEDLIPEILTELNRSIEKLEKHHIRDIIIDPGFGFAKTIDQNYKLLTQLSLFKIFGKPILIGVSRKSMIWKPLGIPPDQALNGTTVLNTIALLQGAAILRVHDVKPAKEAIRLVTKVI